MQKKLLLSERIWTDKKASVIFIESAASMLSTCFVCFVLSFLILLSFSVSVGTVPLLAMGDLDHLWFETSASRKSLSATGVYYQRLHLHLC
jgi:hypothetical protein